MILYSTKKFGRWNAEFGKKELITGMDNSRIYLRNSRPIHPSIKPSCNQSAKICIYELSNISAADVKLHPYTSCNALHVEVVFSVG